MQAERRTSLTLSIRRRLALAFFLVFVIDYLSKFLVLNFLTSPSRKIIGSFLTLSLSRKTGAAFGLGSNNGRAISIFAFAVIATIFYVGFRIDSNVWAFAFGALAGGISGNLSDRIFRGTGGLNGSVVDWIKLPHWPTFNLADLAITTSLFLIALLLWRKVPLNSQRWRNG